MWTGWPARKQVRLAVSLACCSAIAGCNWEPHARNVQPEQLLAGPARVVRLLDTEGRHALFTSGTGDAMVYRILDADTRQSCALMPMDTPVADPLTAPNLKGDNIPAFWMPVLRADPTQPADAPDPSQPLYFTDEKCNLIGPFGRATRAPDSITLRADKRNVSIVPGPSSTLALVDPWTLMTRALASDVSGYTQVSQPDVSSAPEAMWIIENGKLTQRGLDGTLLLSLGSAVSQFQQALLQGALRVTYTDGPNVFEAKGPAFTPVLVADDACDSIYSGTSLDLHTPCQDRQLVRIDLLTGTIKRFTTGVYRAFVQGEANFEWAYAADGSTEVWVIEGTMRTQLMPTPSDAISVLNKSTIAGRTADGTFGVWDTAKGFTAAYKTVDSIQAFRDSRTNRLLWLMQWKIDAGLGPLVGFDQSDLDRIRAGTELTQPLLLGERVLQGAYRVFLPSILPEPMVLTLEPPIATQADKSMSGQLNARLLSGSLASRIDDGVSSSEVALAPYPGILYGILEGPRSGLWFAAL